MLDYITYRLAFRLQQPAKAAAVEVCDDGAGLADDAADVEGDCAGGEGDEAEEDAGEGDVAEEEGEGDVAEEDSDGDTAEDDSDYCEDDGTEEDGANGEGDEAGPSTSSRDIVPTGQRLVAANTSQAGGTPSTSMTASSVEVPHSYGALFHQWCVDAWCRNEQNRLNWFRRETSQSQLRADLYKS